MSYFGDLWRDSLRTVRTPGLYFSTLNTAGVREAVVKALAYGFAAGVLMGIWAMLGMTPPLGEYGLLSEILVYVLTMSLAGVIGVFIAGLLVLVASWIAGGDTDFNRVMTVTAALMVMLPLEGVFAFASGLSLQLGIIVDGIVNLYGLWLLYMALTRALSASYVRAKSVVLVLVLLAVMSTGYSYYSYTSGNLNEAVRGYEQMLEEQGQ